MDREPERARRSPAVVTTGARMAVGGAHGSVGQSEDEVHVMPAKKFIPDGDRDFAKMSQIFEGEIARDPAVYGLSADDAAEITRAVRE